MSTENSGRETESFSYEKAGVNINTADAAKLEMKKSMQTSNTRVLNTLGAFASLVDFSFDDIKEPVMVMKMEEPGSKQLLAAQHGRLPDVGYDLIHHLINDTIVMGARAVAIQDTIVCGELEKETVVALVDTMAKACREQGVDLVGGETSEQPRVIPQGSYILSAACVGVVDKSKIIDGSQIQAGDVILGIASNGIHTNGYTLVRSLLDRNPQFAQQLAGEKTVLDQVLLPHLCYNQPLQKIFAECAPNGLAHITGGGIVDNLKRIMPGHVDGNIDLSLVEVLPIFPAIAAEGNVPHDDMLRTFNMGVGLIAVCDPKQVDQILSCFSEEGYRGYPIGQVSDGEGRVSVSGQLMLSSAS